TLWGWVLDTLHFYMLNPARFLGRDAEAAWESATLLGDEVLTGGAITRKRPRLFPFAPENPRGTWAVRGTCCFEYKSDVEHGYRTTCPLKSDSERRDDLAEWLRDPALAPCALRCGRSKSQPVVPGRAHRHGKPLLSMRSHSP